MKRIILIICLLQGAFLALSQNIKVKKGEVYIDKDLYCLYEETSSTILFSKNITIKNLDNEELFFVRREMVRISEEVIRLYSVVINLQTMEEFEIEEPMSNTLKFVVKNFYSNKVIVDNAINEQGLARFKMKFAGNFKAQYESEAARLSRQMPDVVIINEGNTEDYVLTERNRNALIFVSNGTIKQGNVEIGTYTMTSDMSDGVIINEYRIYDANNRFVAMVEKEKFGKELSYVTMKDNKKRIIREEISFDFDVVKAVVKELVEYMYL